MADFNLAYAPVAKWEGGWTLDSGDKGGETFRGCARNFFPNEPIWPVIDREKSHPSYKKGKAAFSAHLMGIPSLTGCVKGWYKKEWWDKLGLERFDQIVADELFEQAVNLGKAGNPVTPLSTMTKLVNERFRAQINDIVLDPATPDLFTAELFIPQAEGGWYIREVGLWMDDGTLFAVGNTPLTEKPDISSGAATDLLVRLIIRVLEGRPCRCRRGKAGSLLQPLP